MSAMSSSLGLRGKTVFITGASRGIGLAIGLRVAREGANVVVAAKTETTDPRLPGTIYSAAKEIEDAGGKALPVKCDIRSEDDINSAVQKAVDHFGGIDVLINNASAIFLKGTLDTPLKRFDLMHSINTRGTWAVSKACLPHLIESAKRGRNPHILNLSPPLNFDPMWFKPHCAYTIAKYGMSLCVLGMSAEFQQSGVAVNALWPRTTIATAAVNNLLGGKELMDKSRTPDIMGDAAYYILTSPSSQCTGKFFVDDKVLESVGINLDKYSVTPGAELAPDFFVTDDDGDALPNPKAAL